MLTGMTMSAAAKSTSRRRRALLFRCLRFCRAMLGEGTGAGVLIYEGLLILRLQIKHLGSLRQVSEGLLKRQLRPYVFAFKHCGPP